MYHTEYGAQSFSGELKDNDNMLKAKTMSISKQLDIPVTTAAHIQNSTGLKPTFLDVAAGGTSMTK